MLKNFEVQVGDIIKNNYYGCDYIVTEILPDEIINGKPNKFIRIKFIGNGYETKLNITKINPYFVEDPYHIRYFGVACRGVTPKIKYVKPEWDRWYGMLSRCYNEKDNGYKFYGAIGVRVCDRWLCFENFLNDLPSLPGYKDFKRDPHSYHIDKDMLQEGVPTSQKVYSPETCMFLHKDINSRFGALNNIGSNTYVGVYASGHGTFLVSIRYKNEKYAAGTYNNEIAAANMYNHINKALNVVFGLNDVPYMSISECLQYCTSRAKLQISNLIHIPEIDEYNNSIEEHYYGVRYENGHYNAYCTNNGKTVFLGKFDDEIAAANAHNWFSTPVIHNSDRFKLNDVPYMAPAEWFSHKYYNNIDSTKPVQMTTSTNESDDVRRARCRAKYGIDFI